jgi:geranylgeranyl pyrophosphate synthase
VSGAGETGPGLRYLFSSWELGRLMLGVAGSPAGTLQNIAEAAARSVDPDCDAAELAPLIAAAPQVFIPIDNILDGEETLLALEAGPVRTALLCVATVGLIAESVSDLDCAPERRGSILATLARGLRDTAAGQDWDAIADGTEAGYWRAVAGKLEAFAAASAGMGALLAGAPSASVTMARAIGRALGRLGQIADDVLDVTAEPPAADWRRPHCNILLLYGMAPGMPHREEIAEAIAAAADAAARERVRSALLKAGAGAYLRHVVGVTAAQARAALSQLSAVDARPLAREIDDAEAALAALIGAPTPPKERAAPAPEVALPWPLLEEAAPIVEKAMSGTIASWARHACLACGGTAEQAAPAIAILARLVAAIRILDDWQDGDPGIHERIGGGRTANLAVGIAATALQLAAELPLEGEAWQMAVRAVARGLALTLRGQDLDLTAPLDERGYWQVVDTKTPPLIDTALTLGALLGGAPPAQAALIAELSASLGRLVQIGDDIHDGLALPPSGDWRRPERNLLLLYASATLGDRFRGLAAGDPSAARDLLPPGALAYAAHAVLATADDLERRVATLQLARPEALLEPVRRFRNWGAELLARMGVGPALRRAAG